MATEPTSQEKDALEDGHNPSMPKASEVDVPITWEEGEDGTSTVTFQASALPPPIARVGRFDILGRLALGGMAEIYLARESGEGDASRLLVVKFIKTSLGDDSQLEAMFVQEARVAMRLSHPNICHVYEVGKNGGRHFIAMEWVNGVTMRDFVKTGLIAARPIPMPIAAKIAAHIAEALDAAHRARDGSGNPLGVVHRDVSPHNIMVSYDGVVKLLDFGVAKIQESMTQSGTVKGKFAYMSPEQAQCQPLDGRSDVFSLGIVLYEALTGLRAYAGTSEYDSLRAIIESPVPSPRAANAAVPEELDAIVQKALAKRREDRFPNAAAFQVALERWLASEGEVVNAARISEELRELYGSKSRERPKLDRSKEVSGSFSAAAPLSSLVRERNLDAERKTSPVVWVVAALALGAAAAAAGAYWSSAPQAPPPSSLAEGEASVAVETETETETETVAETGTVTEAETETETAIAGTATETETQIEETAATDPMSDEPETPAMTQRRRTTARARREPERATMDEATPRTGRFVDNPF